MKPSRTIFIAILLFSCASSVLGQDEIADWLNPTVGARESKLRYQFDPRCDSAVTDQDAEMGWMTHDFDFSIPVWQDEHREWIISGQVHSRDLNTGAKFPDTAEAFPEDLWGTRMGFGVRQQFENGWVGGGSFGVESYSDQPFNSASEITLNARGYVRIPSTDKNAWLIYANLATEAHAYTGTLPIGAGYYWAPDRQFQALIGVPAVWAQYFPTRKWRLSAFYLFPLRINAKVSHYIVEDVELYAGYAWDQESYLRHDRADTDDRLYYYEQRLFSGVKWNFTSNMWVDLGGGYAFNRFWFEGEDYGDRDDQHIELEDRFYGALRVGMSF